MCHPGPAPFFGNELQVAIHTVKTSTVGPAGQYYNLNPSEGFEHAFIGKSDLSGDNVSGVLPGACDTNGCSFDLPTPEPGLLRVSVSGATTNACDMSLDVVINRNSSSSTTALLSSGTVRNLELVHAASLNVLAGTQEIEFELSWDNDWAHYPGSDVELLVFMPGFPALPLGQTLDAPEKFVINPETLAALLGSRRPVALPAGTWELEVFGFEVNKAAPAGPNERWELRVTVDGTPQLPAS